MYCGSKKSRNRWVKYGEHKTTFFRRSTIQHTQRNVICYLKAENGTGLEERKEIEGELVSYYKEILEEPI